MRTWWLLAVTVAGLGGLGACTYAPDFASDKLVCGPGGTCPKGYACATDSKCWKTGETPGDGETGGSDGGTHPRHRRRDMDARLRSVPTSSDPRVGFVGTWAFTGGTLDGTCTDGSVVHRALTTADYMVINLGTTSSTVLAQYYCQTGWTMQLSSGNTMAVATSNQMCTQRTTDNTVNPPITTAYTWSALTFSFTKTGAMTGTSAGHLMGPFTASDNTMGSCDLTFTGPLTKN